MDDKQKSLESHNELPALHELPFIKWIAALSLLSAFLWGIFYETEKITTFYPVGTIPFVHYLAVIAYMMGSLVAASISGSLLLKAWKASCWSESERNMFYGSLSVGGIFFCYRIRISGGGIVGNVSPPLFLYNQNIFDYFDDSLYSPDSSKRTPAVRPVII